jgi:hypothetical protein
MLLASVGSLALPPIARVDARALPDNRVYELVTSYEDGQESGLNGVETGYGVPSPDGEGFDWQGTGGCCGATSAADELYRSYRGSDGWQTEGLTPETSEPLLGLFEEQVPEFWSSDLSRTIFATPASYASGDRRPPRSHSFDLYLREPGGALDWISQGPSGSGEAPVSAYFEGATPDASEIVFSSNEPLTPNAKGLAALSDPAKYLYVRNVGAASTELVDVDNAGKLLGTYGATIGNGTYRAPTVPTDYSGTTTHAISEDGTKIFFETPPAGAEEEVPAGVAPHLYMRDLSTHTTTPIDDPSSPGNARYEGASADGSLVFFTSDEGLDGASTADELYEFNTTAEQIGAAAPDSSVPISAGGVLGVSAISNDGSHVYFVADGVLASNAGAQGHGAVEGEPNLYVYDTRSATTTFIATLELADVKDCVDTCGSGPVAGLIAEPDVERPSYPTPDGEVLAFESTADLTGQNPRVQSSLIAPVGGPQPTIQLASTAGFIAGHTIEIGSGADTQLQEIEAVDGPTELTLSEDGPGGSYTDLNEHRTGERVSQPTTQAYRYSAGDGSLLCISCAPAGVPMTGSASMGAAGGGSYAPPGENTPLTEDGSRIFFESPNPLVAGVATTAPTRRQPRNVYEWEDGEVSLIAGGSSVDAALDGTTPSGRDVFFATSEQLTGAETGGVEAVYDAREGGGFPQPLPPPAPCLEAACRPEQDSVAFFAEPASATLGPLDVHSPASPALTVARITAAQRRRLARDGEIALRLMGNVAGRIGVEALAKMYGRNRRVAHASASLSQAGSTTVSLRLSPAAMRWLLVHGTLELRLLVHFSAGSIVDVAQLELADTTPMGAPEGKRHA